MHSENKGLNGALWAILANLPKIVMQFDKFQEVLQWVLAITSVNRKYGVPVFRRSSDVLLFSVPVFTHWAPADWAKSVARTVTPRVTFSIPNIVFIQFSFSF